MPSGFRGRNNLPVPWMFSSADTKQNRRSTSGSGDSAGLFQPAQNKGQEGRGQVRNGERFAFALEMRMLCQHRESDARRQINYEHWNVFLFNAPFEIGSNHLVNFLWRNFAGRGLGVIAQRDRFNASE